MESALSPLPAGAGYELAFYGGSFTAIPVPEQEELLSAAAPYMDSGAVSSIRVSTRPDAVDAEHVERLKAHGVETVELGAQSMCDEVLALSGRGHTALDTVRASGIVKAAGVKLVLQMMTGLPGSSDERDVYTAEQIIALRPDGVRIYPTVVIRNTPLEVLWRSGRYKEHTVEDAVHVCARILPRMENAGIPVIRLGLNPTEELSGGSAVAGAYHPALGELVRSRILRQRMEERLSAIPAGSDVRLFVPARQLSAAIGQHRENVAWLREKYALHRLTIVPWEREELSLD